MDWGSKYKPETVKLIFKKTEHQENTSELLNGWNSFEQLSENKGNKIRNIKKSYRKAQSIWKPKETTNRTAKNTYKCMSDKGLILEI